MACNNCCRIPTFRMLGSPAIARARQSRIKLAANHLLDQSANPLYKDKTRDDVTPIEERQLEKDIRYYNEQITSLYGVVL
jgi:hypothetical protein